METAAALAGHNTHAALFAELQALLGDRFTTALAVREQHGHDESYHATHAPDAVVFALTTEEVSQIVKACALHRTPVIAFGTGTSLEGHVPLSMAGSAWISAG